MKAPIILAATILSLSASCSFNGASENRIGKYVYLDTFHKIHISRECASLTTQQQNTKDERILAQQGIEFIDTTELHYGSEIGLGGSWPYKFCPVCVDDNSYAHLSAIMQRNEIK